MSDAAAIANEVRAVLRDLILGDVLSPDAELPRRGLRRSRPQADADEDPDRVQGRRDQAPLPELDGLRVTVPGPDGDEQAVVMDLIPLESVQVRADGDRVEIDFVFCDSYPRHLLEPVPGADAAVSRVVTVPGDPRRDLWMQTCLELVYGHLGEDALTVSFDVDWVSGRYEALVAAELTWPEG